MTQEKQRSGLASYLGKYADRVAFDGKPVVASDEYSLTHYCRVKIRGNEGDTYQNVRLGPTEIYAYPNGDQSLPAVFQGILDEGSFLIPCSRNEKGDFEIITPDKTIQVVPSADTLAQSHSLPQTIVKVNFLNHEPVHQSEENLPAKTGKSFAQSEGYTITYMNGDQPFGPIEYYLNATNGTETSELLGLLGMDGKLTSCTRTPDGNFETEDENHQKKIIASAQNLLKETPDKPYRVVRTDYFLGHPVIQNIIADKGHEKGLETPLPHDRNR